ncbi:MAG: hypothetical protein ACQEXV_14995 [Bacillota bacterium]
MKYRLMPYMYTQAVISTQAGLPLLRPLFLEYLQDPGAWSVEDQ